MQVVKFFVITLLLLSVGACQEKKDNSQSTQKKDKQNEVQSFEEKIKREIESKLQIPANEQYTLSVYKEHLNADEKEDAIITVNRLAFAMKEAEQDNTAKRAEYGYMGNYNFFFYYDGALDKVSVPMPVASSAKAPLEVSFSSIQSEAFKDVQIAYRIRNSKFKNFYFIDQGVLSLVFQWKIFDLVGTDNYEANVINIVENESGLIKDIEIYKGEIENYSKNINNVYSYNPKINKKGEKIVRFFYYPKMGKYAADKNTKL